MNKEKAGNRAANGAETCGGQLFVKGASAVYLGMLIW